MDLRGKKILLLGDAEWLPQIKNYLQEAGATTRNLPAILKPEKYPDFLETLWDVAIIQSHWEKEAPFLETTLFDWQQSLQHTFEHSIFAAQTVAKQMIARKTPGRIIILSSVAGLWPYRNMSMAGTTQAALQAVARIAAVDLAAYNITINIIAAGWSIRGEAPSDLKGIAAIEAHIPLHHLMGTKDIGELCCFLASDAASYITGAIIPVDGGYSITKAGASNIKRET